MKAFPLLGKWLLWKIGRGNKVTIWEDPWISCNDLYTLLDYLRNELLNKEIHNIAKATDHDSSDIWKWGWKTIVKLSLKEK